MISIRTFPGAIKKWDTVTKGGDRGGAKKWGGGTLPPLETSAVRTKKVKDKDKGKGKVNELYARNSHFSFTFTFTFTFTIPPAAGESGVSGRARASAAPRGFPGK